jgi:hypothetical protein
MTAYSHAHILPGQRLHVAESLSFHDLFSTASLVETRFVHIPSMVAPVEDQ